MRTTDSTRQSGDRTPLRRPPSADRCDDVDVLKLPPAEHLFPRTTGEKAAVYGTGENAPGMAVRDTEPVDRHSALMWILDHAREKQRMSAGSLALDRCPPTRGGGRRRRTIKVV